MSAARPAAIPRKTSGVQVMKPSGGRPPSGGQPAYRHSTKENGASGKSKSTPSLNADIAVEILNHCFDDVERFMSRLQQAAEAKSILNQRTKKKKGTRRNKKEKKDYDVLVMKACPPSEAEFVDIFQKIKYSLSLLDRLKSSIAEPSSPKLLHHVFVPLRLMVNTTGGPEFGATVVSPAMSRGAVSLLQDHLTEQEKELWISLGPNWTSACSPLSKSVPPYCPVFMDGWQPPAHVSSSQFLEDPVEQQHKQHAFRESREEQAQRTANAPIPTDEAEGSELPPEGERLYYCSYDFVARNSSELSVLQGETLKVIESSNRWWKCQNHYDQVGFVPSNILEPLSALSNTKENSAMAHRSRKSALSSLSNKHYSYIPPNPTGMSPTAISPVRAQSMVLPSTTAIQEERDGVLIANDELIQRLANGRRGSAHPPVTPHAHDAVALLNYQSSAAEVAAWLTNTGFSQQTVQSLGILTAAQLFSLNKDELRAVSPEEGAKVYNQITVQKVLLEDVRKKTELEAAMEKQKMKIDVI